MKTSHHFIPRRRKAERFTTAGDPRTELHQLNVFIALTASTMVEFHFADGQVLPVDPVDLPDGLAAARERACDYRVILLARENSPPPHRSVYAAIVADEESARKIANYQSRFLTPLALRKRLLTGHAWTLHADDYCHRLREIKGALGLARDGRAQGSINAFYKDAKSYNEGEYSSDDQVLTQEYSTSPAVSSHREESLEWIHVAPPTLDKLKPAVPTVRTPAATPPAVSTHREESVKFIYMGPPIIEEPATTLPTISHPAPKPAAVGGQLGLDI